MFYLILLYTNICFFSRQIKKRCIKHLLIVRIRRDGKKVRYSINKNVVGFTPGELKNKTKELMWEYIASAEFDRGWGKE